MISMTLETAATWTQAEHPAASPHVRTRLLPTPTRLRGEVCTQASGSHLSGMRGGELVASRPGGRMGLTLLAPVNGTRGTGLPVYRTAGSADLGLTAAFDPAADATFGATPQGAFLVGIDVPTTTVPTTPVRNEKQQQPGPTVLRPPL